MVVPLVPLPKTVTRLPEYLIDLLLLLLFASVLLIGLTSTIGLWTRLDALEVADLDRKAAAVEDEELFADDGMLLLAAAVGEESDDDDELMTMLGGGGGGAGFDDEARKDCKN